MELVRNLKSLRVQCVTLSQPAKVYSTLMRLLLFTLVIVSVAHATTNFTNSIVPDEAPEARYPSRIVPDHLRDIVDSEFEFFSSKLLYFNIFLLLPTSIETQTFRIYSNYEFQNYCARLINGKRKLHENTPSLSIGANVSFIFFFIFFNILILVLFFYIFRYSSHNILWIELIKFSLTLNENERLPRDAILMVKVSSGSMVSVFFFESLF